jgi:hypothetical protein
LGTALSRLSHRFELRVAVITAVALLIAQLGAMAHAYTHTSDITPTSTHQSNSGSHDFCSDCLSFSPLLSAAGAPAALPFIEPQGRISVVQTECSSLVDRRLQLAFRSRAPPVTPGF